MALVKEPGLVDSHRVVLHCHCSPRCPGAGKGGRGCEGKGRGGREAMCQVEAEWEAGKPGGLKTCRLGGRKAWLEAERPDAGWRLEAARLSHEQEDLGRKAGGWGWRLEEQRAARPALSVVLKPRRRARCPGRPCRYVASRLPAQQRTSNTIPLPPEGQICPPASILQSPPASGEDRPRAPTGGLINIPASHTQ